MSWSGRRPSARAIAQQNRILLEQQRRFRLAADRVAAAWRAFPEVEAITLFGSVARPLRKEVPRFSDFRRAGVAVWHECKDVDLAVFLTRLDGLRAMARAAAVALRELHAETGVGVANHQVDAFLFDAASRRYLGRLCHFSECPKGKRDCLVPGCGATPFLQQHYGFKLAADALAEDRIVPLFDRASGLVALAADRPAVGEEDEEAPPDAGAPRRRPGRQSQRRTDAL